MNTRIILLALVATIFNACQNKPEEPTGAINGGKAATTLATVEYADNEEFSVDTTYTADGCYAVAVSHKVFAYTEYDRLFSPNGDLLLAVAGASETCDVCGYVVKYQNGRIASIGHTGYFGEQHPGKDADGLYANVLKKWYDQLTSGKLEYNLQYDEEGLLQGIEGVDAPGYTLAGNIEIAIDECPLFWTSDLDGGCLRFYALFKNPNPESSSVSTLYADGKLVAELAYWKDTFIKARTYNRYGQMVAVYDDRDIDVKEQAFFDSWEQTVWYADR